MKLAAIYNVFDGEELLEGSILQLKDHCDLIIAVVQTVSNYGNRYDAGKNKVHDLSIKKLITNQVFYKPNLSLNPSWNETLKRNMGIHEAKKQKCTHFINLDCDEYYDTIDFLKMKEEIGNNNGMAHQMFTYFKYPEFVLDPIENYFVPGICKITPNVKVGNYNCGFYCDPTRKPNFKLKQSHYKMHHFSYIRSSIYRKIENSSARGNILNKKIALQNDLLHAKHGYEMKFYEGKKIKSVKNKFNIKL